MSQKPQVIDVRKSYIPGDPNSICENLVNTQREDGKEQLLPIVAYEGFNFLPTSYGYRSYFGTTAKIDLQTLNSRVQHCVIYQLPNYSKHYIALAEDGIWISQDNKTWLHAKVHSFDANIFEEWTYCLIENVLYMYKQGHPIIYKTSYDVNFALSIEEITPSLLNMAGQLGVFKAGTRLGMWDSMNSISWSSTFDFADFTPSLETLAGNTIFNAVVGKIVTVKNHGEGFLIYATKSIVGATLNLSGNMLWDAKECFSNIGINHPQSVTSGSRDTEHYAYTSAGIVMIDKFSSAAGKYETKWMFPEVFDFLRENRQPVLLSCIHKRYLCFTLFDDRYITRIATFNKGIVDPLRTAVTLASGYWDGDVTVLPAIMDGNQLRTLFQQWLEANQPTTFNSANGCV